MYVVTLLFSIRPTYLDRFRAAMAQQAEASLREEPGCRQFDVCYDPAAPTDCFLYEIYLDEAAFRAHLATAHFKAFTVATANWVASKQVRSYERAWPMGQKAVQNF
jgi:(4S)-4-hydroxy-5-phosphonooxypentane-2,3-dione isomerase